jgi:TetR/AcrR family hemagglutinin/protease transcriptional regulator
MEVFSTKGLGEGKHADLAEIAAVAVPTTFHYFPTREDLIGATLEEVARFLIEEIVARNVDRSQSAPMIIKRVLLAFTDAIDDHPHHIRVWLEWSSSIRDGLWNRYLKFYNVAIRRIKTIINTGKKEGSIHQLVDTEDASRIIVGLAHMITQMKFAGNSRATIEHTIDSLVRGYLGAWRE